MSSLPLTTGFYTIVSFGGAGGFVCRSNQEDFSLDPKPIITTPWNVRPNKGVWEFVRVGDNTFILSNAGAPTIVRDNAVSATVTPNPPPQVWAVTAVAQAKDVYTITIPNTERGWVGAGLGGPIAVEPLAKPNPNYPVDDLFLIKRFHLE